MPRLLILALVAIPAPVACRGEGGGGGEANVAATPDTAAPRELLGTVVLQEAVGSFTPCGAAGRLRLVDRTDGKLREVYETLAGGPEGSVLVDALGRRTDAVPGGEQGQAVEITALRRVSPVGEGPQCRQPSPGAQLLARGNEPFWGVDVLADEILFREPENLEGIAFPAAEPSAEGGRRLWRSRREGAGPGEIAVAVEERECRDSMSGAWFHLTATVEIGERRLEGCAAETGPPEPARG